MLEPLGRLEQEGNQQQRILYDAAQNRKDAAEDRKLREVQGSYRK